MVESVWNQVEDSRFLLYFYIQRSLTPEKMKWYYANIWASSCSYFLYDFQIFLDNVTALTLWPFMWSICFRHQLDFDQNGTYTIFSNNASIDNLKIEELTIWQIDELKNWQFDKLTIWQVDKNMNWQIDKMTNWQIHELANRQIDKLINRRMDKLTNRWINKLRNWQIDKMKIW